MFKISLVLLFSFSLHAAPSPKEDCRAGNYAACSDIDIVDPEAETLYRQGCEHSDGYSCTRLGQYLENKGSLKEAMVRYEKACKLKDKYGCEFAHERYDAAQGYSRCSYDFSGKMRKLIAGYDQMAIKLPKDKNWQEAVTAYQKDSGLPISLLLSSTEKTPGYPDYLKTDGPGGESVYIFLKKIKTKSDSNVTLDKVYEIKDAKAFKAIQTWNVPYNGPGIVAIEGDEVRYLENLVSFCDKPQIEFWITLAIKPSGEFRILPKISSQSKVLKDCPATIKLFPKSESAQCQVFGDLKSKKKRILVFQAPMT